MTVYAPAAIGDAAPVATITGSSTHLVFPDGIALDAAGRIYVVTAGDRDAIRPSIRVYAKGATGNASPTATIRGPGISSLDVPTGIVVDAAGRVFVAHAGGSIITVFPAGANGGVNAEAQIVGSRTGLNGPTFITF